MCRILFFLFFYHWLERGAKKSSESSITKKKILLPPISPKKDQHCVKLFHLMMGVHIKCFFSLGFPRKTYMILVRFLVLGWFWVLRWFFNIINEFIKFPKMFSRYFRSKWIERSIFGSKKRMPHFFWQCSG